MKTFIKTGLNIFALLFILNACKSQSTRKIKSKDYELTIAPHQKALLVVLPCYPCDIANTKAEATFLKDLDKVGVSTLLLNINFKLWLTETEKQEYVKFIQRVLDSNEVDNKNIYIGGFSGGGNVSLLLANHFIQSKSKLDLKGVFIVDSPLDLEHVYQTAQHAIKHKVSDDAYNEGLYIIDLFEKALGKPDSSFANYEMYSPYLVSKNEIRNIAACSNLKVRLYTEPALDWQKQNRNREYEDLNAYVIEKLSTTLKAKGFRKVELIQTENKGYRADGSRNPHSWRIVDREGLLKWIGE
jgi:hypothetical protein